ncbi:hypothetical protein HPB49_016581 [Dermacentor silvarum]|uniref:Uncharacterized protein n=1 Tax=Dermacentor silvarum TaxID=543639 RepID=A0ACB8CAB0_DERSI|nr:hypothetical protein HPB49_016581 [Dermacentor silvarum]
MLTAPKRHGRRKLKSKRSFGSASSGPSNLPSNMKPSLPELFALHALEQKPNEGERRCDVTRNAREAATSKPYVKGERFKTPRTTSSSESSEPSNRKQYEGSASEVVQNQTSFIEEEEVIVCEKPGPKALTESNVEDIVKQLRELLLENGPFQEDDLLKALSPSKAQQIVEVYGALNAFLHWHPGLRVLREQLYSFIYYQHSDDQHDECDCLSLVRDGACTGSCLASTNGSGRQYAVGRDGESRSARVSSPRSSFYGATVNDDDKTEKRRVRNGSTQVPSLPRCESRALQVVQDTCDAEALTHGWDPAPFTELQPKLDKCDAEIAELQEGAENSPREPCAQRAADLRQDRQAAPGNTTSTTTVCGGGNEEPPRHERAEAHWHEWGVRPSHPAASMGTTASEVSTPSSQAPGEAAHASN